MTINVYGGTDKPLRERVREITWEEFCDSHDPNQARANAMRRVRDEYGSIIGIIILGVALKLVIDLIATWIQSFYTKDNPPPPVYQKNEPGYSL